MNEYFKKTITPLNDELGKSLGMNPLAEINGLVSQARKISRKYGKVKTIEVREIKTRDDIEVRKYIKCLNPFNESVFLTEEDILKYELLGLSIRRA